MENKTGHDPVTSRLANLSAGEFMALGADGLAYIRRVKGDDPLAVYAVHSADGNHIASGPDIAVLRAIAAQQNLVTMPLQ